MIEWKINKYDASIILEALDRLAAQMHGNAADRHKSTVLNGLINDLERKIK